MKHVIVGTAGHIDHGKSALVMALTGTDPDRWQEEKRRGITIDLGFAHLAFGDLHLGFVDVPGHERFVRNMLAGVGGIDLVLLVIAADESIKPQTREHFDICRLLGITRGITALTKADLVDSETLELVRLEAAEFLQGSFLEAAPIIPVSSKTGAGMDRLREALQEVATGVPGKDTRRYFRLPIDRAFSMKGFGTVVTGTLMGGSLGRDEEVEVFPQRRKLRVRGLQVHNQAAERALAGQRTAVNLAGVEPGELKRGMVLTLPDRFVPSRRVDVRLQLLPSAAPLRDGARVHFHQGTAELMGEVRLLDRDKLGPGDEGYAQLQLAHPVLLLPDDRFILRRFSPVITIGGGRVLALQPPRRKRKNPRVFSLLQTLDSGDREEILTAMIEHEPKGVLDAGRLIARTGWLPEELEKTVDALVTAGRARRISETPLAVTGAGRLAELGTRSLEVVEAFHRKEPLVEGIAKEELKERVFGRAPEALFNAVISDLTAAGKLSVVGDRVKRAGREVTLNREESEAKESIERAFARAGLTVPSVKEVLAKVKVEPRRSQKIVQMLVRDRALIKMGEGLLFHQSAVAELEHRLRGYKQQKSGRISVAAFKELTGVSRKYAIPLLEYLDRRRCTRREGNERVILL